MIKVKCYGGPAHGLTKDLASGAHRFEMFVEPRIDRRQLFTLRPSSMIPPRSQSVTNTYYLQTYEQEWTTAEGSEVYRRLQVALLDGADLLQREQHELEDAMESLPWNWSLAPSILYQFERWWEKALHDQGVKKVRVYY